MSKDNGSNPQIPPVDNLEIKKLISGVYDDQSDKLHELYGYITINEEWKASFLEETKRRAKKYIQDFPEEFREDQ